MKVFKYGRKSPWVPTLTELFPKIHADAGSCMIGHKKCFVLLCPIGEQFLLSSFREFVHDGYCFDPACLAHAPNSDQRTARSQGTFSLI